MDALSRLSRPPSDADASLSICLSIPFRHTADSFWYRRHFFHDQCRRLCTGLAPSYAKIYISGAQCADIRFPMHLETRIYSGDSNSAAPCYIIIRIHYNICLLLFPPVFFSRCRTFTSRPIMSSYHHSLHLSLLLIFSTFLSRSSTIHYI